LAAAGVTTLRAVLFDVDFTLVKPGADLSPEGYRRLGERHGLTLHPERYAEAREQALGHLQRHPELEHDDEIWIVFTERIIRGMGGDAERAHGKTKPDPTIFRAVLDLLDVAPEAAAMVGDSLEDDIEGARAVGMRAFLVDREDRYPDAEGRLPSLLALPAALGLVRPG